MPKDDFIAPSHVKVTNLPEYRSHEETLSQKNMPVAGIVRVSTKKESQKSSIENQDKILRLWAEQLGYIYVGTYLDVKSGKFIKLRSDIQRLENDIKEGKVKGVLTKDVSRTSRDVIDMLTLKRQYDDLGVFFMSMKEGYDSRQDGDEFLLTIHAGLAQREGRNLGARIKATQMLKAKEGKTNVAQPAFGYKLAQSKDTLEVDPIRGPIYQEMVDLAFQGWGREKIARHLNSKVLPDGSKLRTNFGKPFSGSTVNVILRNPVYMGVTIYNCTTQKRNAQGEKVVMVRPKKDWIIKWGTHEALISVERWEALQRLLDEKATKRTYSNAKNLLTGLTYCGKCGKKMYHDPMNKNRKSVEGYRIDYYNCRKGAGEPCDAPYVHAKWLEAYVIRDAFEKLGDQNELRSSIERQKHLLVSDYHDLKKERQNIAQALEDLQRRENLLMEDREEGIIDREQYKNRMKELRRRKDEHSKKLKNIDAKLKKCNDFESEVEGVIKIVQNLAIELANMSGVSIEEIAATLDSDTVPRSYGKEKDNIINNEVKALQREILLCLITKIIVYPAAKVETKGVKNNNPEVKIMYVWDEELID